MNIKTILLASTVAFAGLSAANAADAIRYEEPAPVVSAPAYRPPRNPSGLRLSEKNGLVKVDLPQP